MGYAGRKTDGVALVCSDDEYRERARGAIVTMSYRVWLDAFAGIDKYRTAFTIEKACELVREGQRSSMQVLFRWRLDDKDGDGCVSYIREDHPTATDQFIERLTRSLIERAIAEDLATGHYMCGDQYSLGSRRQAGGA